MDDVRFLLRNKQFDIFTFSETWLNPAINDSEVNIPGYIMTRHDRTSKRGGGTAIYVRDNIPFKHKVDLTTENIETSWIEVNRPKCKKLFVGCVYRPPNVCTEMFINEVNISLMKLPAGSEIVILGDFNIDFSAKRNDPAFKLKRQLQQFAIANDLEQVINTPTRICNQTRTVIDLVFVNNNHRIVESGVIHSAISDHSIVFCTMKSGVPKAPPKTIEYRSYRMYDKGSFIKDLEETNWDIIDINGDIDPAVEMWNTLFTDVANRHAPIKKTRIKGSKTPWMTPELSNAMRDRDFHHRKAIRANSTYHWDMFKKIKNIVNRQVRKCKAEYYSHLINKNKGNPSLLWKTFNEITSKKSNSTVSSIEADGVQYTKSSAIAQVLNTHFSLIGSKLAAKIKEKLQFKGTDTRKFFSETIDQGNSFSFSPIADFFVLKQLKTLKTNKAIGLDRISARLLKDSAQCMTPV